MKTLGKLLGNLILIICVVCCLSCVVTFFINGKDFTKANVFGYKFTFVMSESMEPEIMTHALCLMSVYNNASDEEIAEDVHVGDIIVYRYTYDDGSTINIIHRVIEKTEDGGFITQGDNNENPDTDVVYPPQVVGQAVYWWNGFANLID